MLSYSSASLGNYTGVFEYGRQRAPRCRRLEAQGHWLPSTLLHTRNTAPKAIVQDTETQTGLAPALLETHSQKSWNQFQEWDHAVR